LARGAAFLKIKPPYSTHQLRNFATELVRRNQMLDSVLRLTLSRGSGPPGYSPQGADQPRVVMTLRAAPDAGPDSPVRWRLVTSAVRVPADQPWLALKTCSRLPQLLARAAAEAQGADEALLLNTRGELAEGSSANLFWIERGVVCTPPLSAGALAGVTREVVFELCRELGVVVRETLASPDVLLRAEGVFLTVSTRGVVEAVSLDGQPLQRSPVVERLRRDYWETVRREVSLADDGWRVTGDE
jgi:branched-subunit amino acid aminotransferase/4-amino-4-deoxychorismate lyase